MRLYDMECKKEDREEAEAIEVAVTGPDKGGGPRYPIGLRLHLGPETLSKLGLESSAFKAGDTVKIAGKAAVKRVVQSDGSEDDHDFLGDNVELQITDLGVQNREDFDTAWDEAMED